MGKLLIATAMLMLVAVANGRADDQVSVAFKPAPPAPTKPLLHPITARCGAAFYQSDMSAALPLAFPAVLCRGPDYRVVKYKVPREQPVAPQYHTAASSGPRYPKIIMGDRPLICGYLVELYDVYCCERF